MTRLREALKTRNEQLLKDVESLVSRATPQLWHTWSTFQTGTKHTPEHTQTVEEIASLLLPDDVIAELKDDEIAMLILACHYHDLGMAGTEADNATGEGRDRVRREHAIAIGDRIREKWQELGFENQNYAEILAEVCRGHRPQKVEGVANWDNLPGHRNVAPNRFVRLRLVSAMIYAADELHLGDDRAPKREEDWKEITSAESLKHWRRHQAVSGPTRPINSISFDVRINTISFEADIRKVFKKAFLAVADLRRELATADIAVELPQLELQWLRESLWKLLITKVCGDGTSRSRDEIRDSVLQEFKAGEDKFEPLTELCGEHPSDDDQLKDQIERAISDFVTRAFLVPGADPASFHLAADSRAAQYLLGLAGEADVTERLFARAIDAAHEQEFYESETGKLFIRECIFPEIKASYAVDVAAMPGNASLRTAIESSPTACKFLRQISTPPGTLVKHDLLQVAVTAGICFDLMNNPELFLDKPLRTAIREIFAGTAERLPRFMNFIQQLAIIKDLSFDQVNEIVIPPASVQEELNRGEGDSFSINVTQQFPQERRDWSFPYLLLAGRRAMEPITILNSPDAPFRITVDSDDEAVSRLGREQPVMVGIAPAVGDVSSIVTLRASVSYDAMRRLLVFTCHRLQSGLPDDLPVVVTLPSSRPEGALNITFSFIETALKVGQLLDLQRASEATTEGELEVQIHVDGVGQLGSIEHSPSNLFNLPEILPTDSLITLSQIDRNLPIPCVTLRGLPEQISSATPENRASAFDVVREALEQNKPSVTSIILRFASVNGQEFREEYLGCLPIGCHFSAPQVTGSSMPQEEIDRIWSSGEEHIKLTSLFREDGHTLAAQIRDWVEDPAQPFPFQSDNNLQVHYCKTRVEQEHLKHIDRFWYVERPVVFRFSPVTKAEQYRVELKYWRSVGGDRRAELLEELIALELAEQSVTTAPDANPDETQRETPAAMTDGDEIANDEEGETEDDDASQNQPGTDPA